MSNQKKLDISGLLYRKKNKDDITTEVQFDFFVKNPELFRDFLKKIEYSQKGVYKNDMKKVPYNVRDFAVNTFEVPKIFTGDHKDLLIVPYENIDADKIVFAYFGSRKKSKKRSKKIKRTIKKKSKK